MNRVRRNVSFEHGGVFDMRENSWDFRHHDDSSVTGMSKAIPVIGSPLVELLCGSASVGQSTLTRFYSLHTFVLPLFTAVFMLMHFPMICNQGISGPL
jgi:cytochrome b6